MMEIKVLESAKKRLVFELKGADHTICNVLKTELWKDKDIDVATYSIEHPLIGIPRIIVETKSGDPKKAIMKAIQNLESQNKEFLTKFKRIK